LIKNSAVLALPTAAQYNRKRQRNSKEGGTDHHLRSLTMLIREVKRVISCLWVPVEDVVDKPLCCVIVAVTTVSEATVSEAVDVCCAGSDRV